jgi:hypothetical protein
LGFNAVSVALVSDPTQIDAEKWQTIADLSISLIDPDQSEMANLACWSLNRIVSAGVCNLDILEVFQRTWGIMDECSAKAALALQLQFLKLMEIVPVELCDCVDWSRLRELVVSDEMDEQILACYVLSQLMRGGETFIQVFGECEFLGVLGMVLEAESPFRARLYGGLTMANILVAGNPDQRLLLLGSQCLAQGLELCVQVQDSGVYNLMEAVAGTLNGMEVMMPAVVEQWNLFNVFDSLVALAESGDEVIARFAGDILSHFTTDEQ